jgi:hypothetical protein
VNAHISVVPATATIEEVADDNDNLYVSLYMTVRSRWMVDSGAMHHITPHRSNFATWALACGSVSLGGHTEIAQIGTGTVQIRPSRGDQDVYLQDVMHVPDVEACYFSVSALLKKGGKIIFKDNTFAIELRGQQLAKGYMEGNLFWFDSSKAALHTAASTSPPIDIWHYCMGHMLYNALTRYHNSVKGISITGSIDQTQSSCVSCELGKQA